MSPSRFSRPYVFASDGEPYGPPPGLSAEISEEELAELRRKRPKDLEDEEIVHLIQNGDEHHFDLLVGRYQDRIYNTSMRILGDSDEALDATQEVFIKAYRGIPRFAFKSTFYTWLYQIALNYCRSLLRSRSRAARIRMLPLDVSAEADEMHELSIPDEAPPPLEKLEMKELHDAAEEALLKLRPEFREVIVLRDVDGMNYDQIAIVLDCSMGTVKSRLHRARNALASLLTRYLESI